jgi:restriction endonuclease S subunit
MIRFNPVMSRKDWILTTGDVLFMARGARNYSVVLQEIPAPLLAAACFFIVRVSSEEALPSYLCWYLNQASAQHYLSRHSGRGVHMPVVRRSVLEDIDIPLPPLETQKKITALDALMREEEILLNDLAQKQKELITATCLQAARDTR